MVGKQVGPPGLCVEPGLTTQPIHYPAFPPQTQARPELQQHSLAQLKAQTLALLDLLGNSGTLACTTAGQPST